MLVIQATNTMFSYSERRGMEKRVLDEKSNKADSMHTHHSLHHKKKDEQKWGNTKQLGTQRAIPFVKAESIVVPMFVVW